MPYISHKRRSTLTRNASRGMAPRDDWPSCGRWLFAVRKENDSRRCHIFAGSGSRVIKNANGGDGGREFSIRQMVATGSSLLACRLATDRSVVELCKRQGSDAMHFRSNFWTGWDLGGSD